jgi:hypothetical protein
MISVSSLLLAQSRPKTMSDFVSLLEEERTLHI